MNESTQVAIPHSDQKVWVEVTKVKAPKLRFKPGMLFIYDGEIIVVTAAYRLRDDDREWLYQCSVVHRQVTDQTKQQALDRYISQEVSSSPSVPSTARVTGQWLFRNSVDAYHYYSFAAVSGCDGRVVTNKDLLQKGERLIDEPQPISH